VTYNFIVSKLSEDQQVKIVAVLCDGVSIRAAERITGCHRDTIMRLGLHLGQKCAVLHDKLMTDLNVSRVELDELWSFVGKKRRNVAADDPDTVGDQFIYVAMDSAGKAIVSWLVGKRNAVNTNRFVADVRRRVLGTPEISTDGYLPYLRAVDAAFEGTAPHGIVDKQIVIIAKDGDKGKYYARESLVKVERTAIAGAPSRISTSFIERQNLTLRMSQRRLTRLTNGHSKKFENHCAAVALYVSHYNFCRVHQTLRITPAMQLGVTDHVWSISELLNCSSTLTFRRGRFTVFEGGKQL
jgi:IS1 family transposase